MLGLIKRLLGGNVSAHSERKEKMRRINTEFDIRMRELYDERSMQISLLVAQLDKQLSELKSNHERERVRINHKKDLFNDQRSLMLKACRENDTMTDVEKRDEIERIKTNHTEKVDCLRIEVIEIDDKYHRDRNAVMAKYNEQRLRINEDFNRKRGEAEMMKVKQMSEI